MEACKNVPKYLFRMFWANSGNDSRLNTVSAVTPHAFLHGRNHNTVYDMTRSEFVDNTNGHVRGHKSIYSEFSSWSQSPYFPFNYAMNLRKQLLQSKGIHIAIMDTERLVTTNPAFHVGALGKIFEEFEPDYAEEYLVHGVVQGEFYKAVPLDSLLERGLLKHLPNLITSEHPLANPGSTQRLPSGTPFEIGELHDLKQIGLLYGKTFSIPFAITLFCCRKHPDLWSTMSTNDLKKIVRILGGNEEIPLEWAASRTIFCDGVYPEGYEANQQMVNVMRALHEYAWGKGARGRERIAAIIMDSDSEDSSSDDDFDPEESGWDADSHSDEEGIVSSMSAMRMNPTAHMNSRGIDHPQPVSIQKLPSPRPLVPNGKSRKRARLSVLSFGLVPDPWGHLPTRSVPPSSISSPSALWATDYYESGMGMANTEVTDLYAASKESQSTILHPDKIKHACITGHLVATWCVNKFNYRRLSYYKKLEFWLVSTLINVRGEN
ncbi:hypothetical protein D6C90_02353 [Aureobasidium pullulans]|uniref:DUF7587 domain-containing protein n=1 Tax=Aureobasidium pullulans TaxID=5580 RepID=A0A4S9VFR2_AURPU|nr:hypothetical protein D6C90_02353 [Aureobasidium pullulans]